jgi:hypothetical protein
MVDAIGLSCLDMICSSTLLVCTISLFIIYVVMIYQLPARVISYEYLLIYSTFGTARVPVVPAHRQQPQAAGAVSN